MHSKPLVVFCLYRNKCLLAEVLEETSKVALAPTDGEPVHLAARILRVYDRLSEREAWIRVSSTNNAIEVFEQVMKRTRGLRYQLIHSAYQSRIYRIMYHPKECRNTQCPFINPPPGSMVKTMVVIPHGAIVEYIISKTTLLNELKKTGCTILLAHPIEEMDYMLTIKQEQVLVNAYLRGFYSYPRKIKLTELSRQLGISPSTLLELLRRAEAKIVEAFIRHELPHYIVRNVLHRTCRRARQRATIEAERVG